VEGLLDLHFYDFTFQREVQVEGSSTAWNTWTRNTDRANEDRPSPKKQKRVREVALKKEVVIRIRERGTYPHRNMEEGINLQMLKLGKKQRKMILSNKKMWKGVKRARERINS
jgi:hypothetical protein